MTDNIKNIIDKFEAGYIFTADDFSVTVREAKNVSKKSCFFRKKNEKIVSLRIVDLSGKTIYQFNEAKNQINVSALLQRNL